MVINHLLSGMILQVFGMVTVSDPFQMLSDLPNDRGIKRARLESPGKVEPSPGKVEPSPGKVEPLDHILTLCFSVARFPTTPRHFRATWGAGSPPALHPSRASSLCNGASLAWGDWRDGMILSNKTRGWKYCPSKFQVSHVPLIFLGERKMDERLLSGF